MYNIPQFSFFRYGLFRVFYNRPILWSMILIVAVLSQGHVRLESKTERVISHLYEIEKGIEVDGSLSDWEGQPKHFFNIDSVREHDSSSVWMQGWDSGGIVFALRVYDRSMISGDKDFAGDLVEIFFSTEGESQLEADIRPVFTFDCVTYSDSIKGTQGVVDDHSPDVLYHGAWRKIIGSGAAQAHGNTLHETLQGDASLELTFQGDSFSIIGIEQARTTDVLEVYVDGELHATVDPNQGGWGKSTLLSVKDLSNSEHRVFIQNRGYDSSLTTASHIKIPIGENSKQITSESFSLNSEGREEMVVVLKTCILGDGYIVEGRIPFEALKKKFVPGERVKFGFKVTDNDEGSDVETVMGLVARGENTTPEFILLRPNRFPTVQLSGSTEMSPWNFDIKEECRNGKTFIAVTCMAIAVEGENATSIDFAVEVGGSVFSDNLELLHSSNGLYKYSKLSVIMPTENVGDEVRFTATILDRSGRRLAKIVRSEKLYGNVYSERINNIIGENYSDPSSVVYSAEQLYKEIAKSLIKYAPRRDFYELENYSKLNYYNSDSFLDSQLNYILEALQSFRNIGDPGQLGLFAYRSDRDGSMQPIRVLLPPGYEKTRRYPVKMCYLSLNEARDRLHFIQREMNAKNVDQAIMAIMYGRSNNELNAHFEDIPNTLSILKKYFLINENSLTLVADSDKTAVAMELFENYPDLFDSLDIRGPSLGKNQRLLSSSFINFKDRSYVNGYQNVVKRLSNVSGKNIRFAIGEYDTVGRLSAVEDFCRLAEKCGINAEVAIVSKEGHIFDRPELPVLFLSDSNEPSDLCFTASTLRYGSRFGLTALMKKEVGRDYSLSVHDDLSIRTENVSKLKIDSSRLIGLGNSIVIDGQEVSISERKGKGRGHIYLSFEGRRGWVVGSEGFNVSKVYKSFYTPGPLGDALNLDIAVVYGTQMEEFTEILQKRARLISEMLYSCTNIGNGESAFIEIYSDDSVPEQILASKTIWLIGSKDQNSIVSRLAASLPLPTSGEGSIANMIQYDLEKDFLVFTYPNVLAHRIAKSSSGFGVPRMSYLIVESSESKAAYERPLWDGTLYDFYIYSGVNYDKIRVKGLFSNDWKVDSSAIVHNVL